MIAYSFPPEGNAGTYRPLRFVRQLPNHGWKPIVISAIPNQYDRYDPALLEMIPKEIEVIRTKAGDLWQMFQAWRGQEPESFSPSGPDKPIRDLSSGAQRVLRAQLRKIVRTAEAWWYHPDMASPWLKSAVEAATQVCKRDDVSVIWATAGPVTSFYVARRVSHRAKIPYVLDFRDSWTITHNDFEARRPFWAIRRDRREMFSLLHDAQAVIFRYEAEGECFWRAYKGAFDPSRVYIIPNGYEAPIDKFVAPDKRKCTILYAGTLPDYRYDSLLQSLCVLKERDPRRAKQLRVLFVGEGMGALADEAATFGLTDIVEISGPKSYGEITRLQRETHALLVLGRSPAMNGYELFAGAKLFGYLKTGRPIVGVLPADETRNVLQRLGVSTLADVDSISDITRVLQRVIDNWCAGTLESMVPDRKACEAYSSERQTATLVRALEGLPAEEEFVPGTCCIPPSLRETIGSNGFLDN
jgi:hypothetical protein